MWSWQSGIVGFFTAQQLLTLTQLKTKRENFMMLCFFVMDYVYLYLQYQIQSDPFGPLIGFCCKSPFSSPVLYGLVPWFLFPFSTYQYAMIIVGIVLQGYLTSVELAKDTIYTMTKEKMRTFMIGIMIQVVLISAFYASLVGLLQKVSYRTTSRLSRVCRTWRYVWKPKPKPRKSSLPQCRTS